MSLNDPIANNLSHILNCEKVGKKECTIHPVSKLLVNLLKIMKDHKYIGEFKVNEDNRGGSVHINLIGNINSCGVIKPHFPMKLDDLEKFEKRFLPAKGFGLLIVSTSKGIMIHKELLKHKVGGRLLAFIY